VPKVKSNDVEIYYEIRGKGTPLVMINGWTASSERWPPKFIEELAKYHKLILVDNRGTGRSDKPDVEYSIKQMAHDVASVMDVINISKAHVFGASMGGMIAQEFALHYPEKVEGLILGCSTCGGSQMIWSEEVRKLIVAFASGHPPEMSPELQNKMLRFSFTPSFLKENLNTIMKGLIAIKYPTPAFAMGRQAQAILSHDTYDRLTQIEVPTLVLYGEEDIMMPIENSRILAEMIPNTKIKMFDSVGHNFTAGIEKKVAEVILEFLAGVEKTS
jgi:pimeloyl-ACP methyl ester carboxylesterase